MRRDVCNRRLPGGAGYCRAIINMRKRLNRSVSGTPVLKGDLVELNFVTDPAISTDDVTVEMSRSELDRLHRRISDRLSHALARD